MPHRSSGGSPTSMAGVHKNHGQTPRDRRFRLQGNQPFDDSFFSTTSYSEHQENLELLAQLQETIKAPKPIRDPAAKPAEKPDLEVNDSHRRSNVLSQCMAKEHVSFRPMGRGKDGSFHYAIYLEESQGFCWNTNLQKFNSRLMPDNNFGYHPLCDTIYDVFSEDDEDDEGRYHDLNDGETTI